MEINVEADFVKLHRDEGESWGWGIVSYSQMINGKQQSIEVTVLLDNLSVPADRLMEIALMKADAFLIAVANR